MKKILALVLVAMLVIGMAPAALALNVNSIGESATSSAVLTDKGGNAILVKWNDNGTNLKKGVKGDGVWQITTDATIGEEVKASRLSVATDGSLLIDDITVLNRNGTTAVAANFATSSDVNTPATTTGYWDTSKLKGVWLGYLANLSDTEDLGDTYGPGPGNLKFSFLLAENFIPNEQNRTLVKAAAGLDANVLNRFDIKDRKIKAELRITTGQRVISDWGVDYVPQVGMGKQNTDLAFMWVEFKDRIASLDDGIDYKFKVYLTEDKKKMDNTEVTFEGTWKQGVEEVYADDIYVYLGDDVHLIESKEYNKDIEVELGGDIFMYTKLFNNKNYYGFGEAKVYDSDDAIITKYPDIDQVYNLETIGFNNTYTTVKVPGGSDLYVYNANLEYVGTANQKVPYSAKYYVSAVMLDVDGEDVSEPSDDGDLGDDSDFGADMGGDDVPENVNDNPGTGC